MINYNDISYLDKLEQLQHVFVYSTKLSEAIGISRRTLLNWRSKPISAENRLNIDVLYCKHFVIPNWDDPKNSFDPVLWC